MPPRPDGEKRPADDIGNGVMIAKTAPPINPSGDVPTFSHGTRRVLARVVQDVFHNFSTEISTALFPILPATFARVFNRPIDRQKKTAKP